jgi:hypothetical protein
MELHMSRNDNLFWAYWNFIRQEATIYSGHNGASCAKKRQFILGIMELHIILGIMELHVPRSYNLFWA